MPEDLVVPLTLKALKTVRGIGLSTARVMKDGVDDETVLSSFGLHVLYLAEDGTKLGVARIEIGDGLITETMKTTYAELKVSKMPSIFDPAYQTAYDAAIADKESIETAEGLGRAAGNEALIAAGVVQLDPQTAWTDVVTQVEGGASADAIVTVLCRAGPTDQAWGRKTLVDAWRGSSFARQGSASAAAAPLKL